MLEGSNLVMPIGGVPTRCGFFTTRYVECEDEAKAEQLARALALEELAGEGLGSEARVEVEEMVALVSFDGVEPPGKGFSFFLEESEEVPPDEKQPKAKTKREMLGQFDHKSCFGLPDDRAGGSAP